MVLMVIMKVRSNVRPSPQIAILAAAIVTLSFASQASASDADKCASMIQLAYGKYYGCTLKAHSKATKKGEEVVDLLRCQAKLDKLVDRAKGRYGPACPDINPTVFIDFANQCVADTAGASTGTTPASELAAAETACTGGTAFDATSGRCRPLADVYAADPPEIDQIRIDPHDDNTAANVEVTFSDGERRRLPSSFTLDAGDRNPITLTAQTRDRLVYSGTIPYDRAEWQTYNEALAASFAAADGKPTAYFEGRVKVGEATASPPFLPTGAGKAAAFFPPVMPFVMPVVDPEKTLMITHTDVVEDTSRTFDPCGGGIGTPTGTPMGAWTFGRLMTDMANTLSTSIDPETLTRSMMESWLIPQLVNGHNVAERLAMQDVLDRWEAASGGTGTLDLGIAPFRLLAIVNRTDLRQTSAYGGGDCGEGRFVFGLIDTDTCNSLRFGLIFEYGVPISSCRGCRKYARKWLDLQDPTLAPVGSPAYNTALEDITQIFAGPGADPSKPNGNPLNQIRTNENALETIWEQREFTLSPATGLLEPATTKQNPDMLLNFTTDLENWANPIATDICANNFTVPDEHPIGTPFLAGAVPYFFGDFFDGTMPPLGMPDRCARFELSLNTCAACHSGETNTTFCHVGNNCTRPVGAPAALSGFLTGITVPDPADGAPIRDFNDLERREIDLWMAANVPCFPRLALPILKAVH